MCNLYERIQKECLKAGTTPSAMCEAIGISKTVMSNLKNGKNKSLAVSTLNKIADYLGIAVSSFFEEETPRAAERPALSEAQLYIIEVFNKLNYSAQRRLIEYAEDLATLDKYKKESAL